eukprot:63364-Lingulodinium_polyedra.AAC.1
MAPHAAVPAPAVGEVDVFTTATGDPRVAGRERVRQVKNAAISGAIGVLDSVVATASLRAREP